MFLTTVRHQKTYHGYEKHDDYNIFIIKEGKDEPIFWQDPIVTVLTSNSLYYAENK